MFKISVISDEISQDFSRILAVAEDFPILQGVEPRSIWDKALHDLSDDEAQRIKQMCDDAGLEIVCLAAPFFKCDMGDQQQYDQHLKNLRRYCELCHLWDCNIIRGFTFWKTAPASEVWDQLIEAYQEPIALCEQEDVYIGIENEGSTHIGTAREAEQLYQALGSPRVRAIWDPANEVYEPDGELPYPDAFERMKPYLIHVHLKDAVKDPSHPEGGRCVPVGEGGYIDFPAQFRALIDMGYEGACSLETHWRPTSELSTELMNQPGGAAFSEGGEEASRICLGNITRIIEEITS
jgi:sugar phosphate isomerase/epimerase